MKKVLLINPGVSSLNIGDEVISDGVKRGLHDLLEKSLVTEISSHLPLSLMYTRAIGSQDYKFVCGSNLLRGKMNRLFKQWHISYKDIPFLKGAVLVGAGWWQYNDEPNLYTKILYKSILSKKYIHSVRDDYTVQQLNKMGIYNVINTGCATMWELTEKHCSKISQNKSETVVFTLTDYNRDLDNDKKLVQILLDNYKSVHFWIQGSEDDEYIREVCGEKMGRISIIPPSLKAYDKFLDEHECDYVGTRLHAGIRALQHTRRTIIIAVDNRAKEKKKDFNIVCVERDNQKQLEKLINTSWPTQIVIPIENINKWKQQFR